MKNNFDKLYNILEKCYTECCQKKDKKRKKQKGTCSMYVPQVGDPNDESVDTVEEYYITTDKMENDVKVAAGPAYIDTRFSEQFGIIKINRINAADFLSKLKRKGYTCIYRHPVEDPATIVIFPNEQVYKRNLKTFLGFIKY